MLMCYIPEQLSEIFPLLVMAVQPPPTALSRRSFIESAALIGAGSSLFPGILYARFPIELVSNLVPGGDKSGCTKDLRLDIIRYQWILSQGS